jgi:IS5 family transposase
LSRIPLKYRKEQAELKTAEDAAASTWQAWHDAKEALGNDASEPEKAEVNRLKGEAERKQDDLKALQPMC